MIVTAKRFYPAVFGWRPDHWIDDLTGSSRLGTTVDAGASTDDVVDAWRDELARLRAAREPCLLYQ